MIFGFNTDVKVGSVVYHVQSEARQKDLLLQTQVFVRGQCIGKCTSPFPEEEVLLDFAEDTLQQALKTQHRRIVAAVREESLEQELSGVAVPTPSAQEKAATAVAEIAPSAQVPALQVDLAAFLHEALSPPALPSDVPRAEVETPSPIAAAASATSEKRPDPAEARPENLTGASSAVSHEVPAGSQDGETLAASPEGLATGSLKIECTNAQWIENEQSLLLVLRVYREETPIDSAALTLRLAIGQARPLYAYSSTDGHGVAALAITIEDVSGREGKVLVQAESDGESATRRFHLHPLS
jgi:hypothetical protein